MKVTNNKFYIIRHIPTGLVKASGHNRRFSKVGKLWLGGRVKTHLRQYLQYARRYYYRGLRGETGPLSLTESMENTWGRTYPIDECEVVELEVVETRSQPLRQFIELEMKER